MCVSNSLFGNYALVETCGHIARIRRPWRCLCMELITIAGIALAVAICVAWLAGRYNVKGTK